MHYPDCYSQMNIRFKEQFSSTFIILIFNELLQMYVVLPVDKTLDIDSVRELGTGGQAEGIQIIVVRSHIDHSVDYGRRRCHLRTRHGALEQLAAGRLKSIYLAVIGAASKA